MHKRGRKTLIIIYNVVIQEIYFIWDANYAINPHEIIIVIIIIIITDPSYIFSEY